MDYWDRLAEDLIKEIKAGATHEDIRLWLMSEMVSYEKDLFGKLIWTEGGLEKAKIRQNALCSGINAIRAALNMLWDKIDDYPFYSKHGTWCTAVDLLDDTSSIMNIASNLLKAANDRDPSPKEKIKAGE